MNDRLLNKHIRRQNTYMSGFSNNYNFLINPWIPTMWSFIFPGFGHLFTNMFLEGYILVIWEIIVNTLAHLNEAMMYSFQGKFELAKKVLNLNWGLMYVAVYIFAAWDSYRSNVDTNSIYDLAERDKATIKPMQIAGLSIVYLEKYKPKIVALWSTFMPGLGQIILHKIPMGSSHLGANRNIYWIYNRIYL